MIDEEGCIAEGSVEPAIIDVVGDLIEPESKFLVKRIGIFSITLTVTEYVKVP